MNGWKRTGLAILTLGVAVLAALPFFRPAGANGGNGDQAGSGVLLESPRLVPLQVDAQPGVSPALALYEEDSSPAAGQVRTPVIRREPRVELISNLDPVVPVPELPRNYQPTWLSPDVRPLAPNQSPRPQQPEVIRHRIADGDTLSRLAERYLGDANQYLRIFEANRNGLSAPDVLPVAVEIVIPAANASSAARQPAGGMR